MLIAVTGATGFIGKRVVKQLLSEGHQLHIYARPTSALQSLETQSNEITVFRGSLSDHGELCACFSNVDSVIHLACTSNWNDIGTSEVISVAVDGSIAVAKAIKDSGAGKLVYISSAAAAGFCDGPSSEPLVESSYFDYFGHGLFYAEAKCAAELELTTFCSDNQIPLTILCPGEVYGSQDDKKVTASNVEFIMKSCLPVIPSKGGVSVTHVEDVANAIVKAATSSAVGRYFLGGENVTLKEFADLVCLAAHKCSCVVPINHILLRTAVNACQLLHLKPPVAPALVPFLDKYWWISSEKASKDLGYSPRLAIDCVSDVVDWLLLNKQ
ncbi:hypothetical protein RCL1_004435 [Eukaryota sp. TZLM3-RCL]